jgi:hypothetical protein
MRDTCFSNFESVQLTLQCVHSVVSRAASGSMLTGDLNTLVLAIFAPAVAVTLFALVMFGRQQR